MHETPITQIDPDMGHAIAPDGEENKIARLQLVAIHRPALALQFTDDPGQIHPHAAIAPLHQTTAIEPSTGIGAAPAVGPTDLFTGQRSRFHTKENLIGRAAGRALGRGIFRNSGRARGRP